MKSCNLLVCGTAVLCSAPSVCRVSAFVSPVGGIVKQHKHDPANAQLTRRCANHDCVNMKSTRLFMSTSGTGDGNTDRHRGFSLGGPANFADGVKAALTTVAIGLALVAPLISVPDNASAANKREIGSISASGFLFKDKLNVEGFTDPKVDGVTLYLSDFSRPVADKILNGDIFSDPSSASMTCVRSGTMAVKDGINTSKEGEELLKEDRSFFKSIVVRRLYDKEANNVVYVSYSSKLDTGSDANKSRFKSSLCALHVE